MIEQDGKTVFSTLITSTSNLSPVCNTYRCVLVTAKGFLQRDEVYEAYLCYHEAQQLHPSEKMERKLAKMKVP